MIEMTLRGDDYERGCQHGQAFRRLILERINRFNVATLLHDRGRAEVLWNAMGEFAPEVSREIQGIAVGAGADLMTVFAITAARELSHGNDLLTEGCTNVCRVINGDAVIAKNSDGDPRLERYVCIQRAIREDGPSFVAASFIGGVGSSFGVNEAGLAFASASIPAPGPVTPGLPPISLSHLLLSRANTVSEVVAIAQKTPVSGDGAQTIWVDASGAVARLETLPGSVQCELSRADSGTAHANWPLIEASVAYAHLEHEHVRDSTLRLESVSKSLGGLSTLDGLSELLRTHGSGGLCRHGELGMYTVLSGIACSGTRRIFASSGSPCAHEFEEYHLES